MAASNDLRAERQAMIACYALYELRDLLGADDEPAAFKRTRLELRRRLEEGAAGNLAEAVRPHLELVQ